MKNYKMPKLDVYDIEAKFAFAAASIGLENAGNAEYEGEESGDIQVPDIFG